MGQAIVYCWKCQKQLRTVDFQERRAFQAGGHVSCSACAGELALKLEGLERERLLEEIARTPPSTGSADSKPPAKSTSRAPALLSESSRSGIRTVTPTPPAIDAGAMKVFAGLLGGGLIAVVLVLALRGEGSGKAPDRSEHEPVVSKRSNGTEGTSRQSAADLAILRARAAASSGADLDAQVHLWEGAISASENTSRLAQAKAEYESLLARRRIIISKDLDQMQTTIRELETQKEFRRAAYYLRSARGRHEDPGWVQAVDRLLGEIREKEQTETRSPGLDPELREGLTLWLRGDSGVLSDGFRVSRWADQSAGRRDAGQNNPAQQPRLLPTACNGKPALGFDGAATSMTFSAPVNGLEGMTIFLVSACSRDVGAASGSDSSVLYWDAAGPHGKLYLAPFQTAIRFKIGAGLPNGDVTFRRPGSLGSGPTLTVLRKEGPVLSLYADGKLAEQKSGMGSQIAECRDQGWLGIGKNGTHFSGCIAEILIYSRALADPERGRVERYLMDRYSLPAR